MGTAEEALDVFAQPLAQLVLIDVMLPGLDGFDLCRRLSRSSDVP